MADRAKAEYDATWQMLGELESRGVPASEPLVEIVRATSSELVRIAEAFGVLGSQDGPPG